VLEISDLHHSYRKGEQKVPVLRGVDLSVNPGERVSVMGKSGSGKTTLLDLVGGILTPDSGTVRIKGTTISALNESRRTAFRRQHIGMIFQFFNLIPTLTARENIAFPLDLNETNDEERVENMLETLEMSHRADAFPSTLSGGERQRVGIARALVHRPRVLLADEPTGSLDYELSRSVLDTLCTLCDQEGVALLMGTHDQECASVSDRVFTLRNGSLEVIS